MPPNPAPTMTTCGNFTVPFLLGLMPARETSSSVGPVRLLAGLGLVELGVPSRDPLSIPAGA